MSRRPRMTLKLWDAEIARAYATSGALDRKRDCATEAWRIADACDDKELIDALRDLPN